MSSYTIYHKRYYRKHKRVVRNKSRSRYQKFAGRYRSYNAIRYHRKKRKNYLKGLTTRTNNYYN